MDFLKTLFLYRNYTGGHSLPLFISICFVTILWSGWRHCTLDPPSATFRQGRPSPGALILQVGVDERGQMMANRQLVPWATWLVIVPRITLTSRRGVRSITSPMLLCSKHSMSFLKSGEENLKLLLLYLSVFGSDGLSR